MQLHDNGRAHAAHRAFTFDETREVEVTRAHRFGDQWPTHRARARWARRRAKSRVRRARQVRRLEARRAS